MLSPFCSSPLVKPRRSRSGLQSVGAFSLFELLLVVGVITLLAALMVPIFGKIRDSGNKSKATANIRRELSVWFNYAADHNGQLMPTYAGPHRPNDEDYWLQWMHYAYPSETNHTAQPKFYGFNLGPVAGPLDDPGYPWLGINIFMGPSSFNGIASDYLLSRIQHPSKTVVFADSKWDVFIHTNAWGAGGSLTYRYDNQTTSLFGFADGHVEAVVTRDPISGSGVKVPSGFYYSLTQTEPSL